MVPFLLTLQEAKGKFLSDIYREGLVEPLDIKFTIVCVVGAPLCLGPLEFLTRRFVHSELPTIHQRLLGFLPPQAPVPIKVPAHGFLLQ